VPQLIVVVGPIASGKSTVADRLGRRFRDAGRPVAVLDLDDAVEAIGGFNPDLTPERFRQAQLVFGQLVAAWLGQGIEVIAHGPFFQAEEDEALLHALPAGTELRRVLLLTTYEVALERMTADPERRLSRYPAILRGTYDRVDRLLSLMPRSDWTFSTTTTSADQIVDQLAAVLLVEAGEGEPGWHS
jgi:hypothetical protein